MPLNIGARVDLPASPATFESHPLDGAAAASPLAGLRMRPGEPPRPRSDALPAAPRPAAFGPELVIEHRGATPARADAFDRPVLLPSALDALPAHFWGGVMVRLQVEILAAKLARGKPLNDRDVKALSASLHHAAAKATKAAGGDQSRAYTLALSDSKAFEARLLDELGQTRAGRRNPVAVAHNYEKSRMAVEKAWNQGMTGVLDRDVTPPGQQPMSQIVVAGRVYAQRERLGGGNFGDAVRYECVGDPGRSVVVKKQREVSPGHMAEAAQEGRLLVAAMGTGGGADHIAPLVGVVRTPDGVHLVLAQAEHGALDGVMQRLDEAARSGGAFTPADLARFKLVMMLDIVDGVQRLHEAKGVAHRDLAGRNVLLDGQGMAQLADFGLARGAEPGSTPSAAQFAGGGQIPVRWASPERMGRAEFEGPASEVWSLGQTMAELVLGKRPGPEGLTNAEFKDAAIVSPEVLQMGRLAPESMPGVDAEGVRALVNSMLQPDVTKRALPADVRQALLDLLGPQPGIAALRSRALAALGAPVPASGVAAEGAQRDQDYSLETTDSSGSGPEAESRPYLDAQAVLQTDEGSDAESHDYEEVGDMSASADATRAEPPAAEDSRSVPG